MKRLACLVTVGLISLALIGCGGKSDYDTYGKMHQNHDLMETARITNQSNSIAAIADSVANDTTDPTARAMAKAMGIMAITQLKPNPLDVESPTTGMDVLKDLVAHTPFAIMGGTVSYMSYLMAENAGNKFFMDDNASINESFKSDYSWMQQRDTITETVTNP